MEFRGLYYLCSLLFDRKILFYKIYEAVQLLIVHCADQDCKKVVLAF